MVHLFEKDTKNTFQPVRSFRIDNFYGEGFATFVNELIEYGTFTKVDIDKETGLIYMEGTDKKEGEDYVVVINGSMIVKDALKRVHSVFKKKKGETYIYGHGLTAFGT